MRRDPQTAAELVAAIALHYGPGPHPDGSAQQVHAGGTATARPAPAQPARPQPAAKPARRAAKAAPADQMAFDFTAAPVDDSPQARFIAAAQAGRVAAEKKLGGGVTDSRLVDYVDDGQGVWKAITDNSTLEATGHNGHGEVAAYRLAELLGMDIVPPTVYSTQAGVPGTSQQFISDLRSAAELPSMDWPALTDTTRIEDGLVLDVLIQNGDRHAGNVGFGSAGRLWAIDHGHAKFLDAYINQVYQRPPDAAAFTVYPLPPPTEALTLRNRGLSDYATLRWRSTAAGTPEHSELARHLPADTEIPEVWRVTPAKLARWRTLSRADIERAVLPGYPGVPEDVRADWQAKAGRVYTNLRNLTTYGNITWW